MSRITKVVVTGPATRVEVDGAPLQTIVHGEQQLNLVNVGPPGPPGSGLQITGVVDTASELPANAAPGDAYLVTETNTVSAWVAGAWWNLGGPMQGPQGEQGPEGPEGPQGPKGDTGPPPQINDLPTRPGGPQPTDEFWLASAGAAADFKSTIAALAGAVLGNIIVTENANGISVRIPEAQVQICWIPPGSAVATDDSQSGLYRTPVTSLDFPEPFSSVPVIADASLDGGGVNSVSSQVVSRTSTRVSFRGWGINNGQSVRFGCIAIGRY